MKHTKHILLMAALLLGSLSVSAEVVQIDGIWYDIVKKTQQAKVTRPTDGTKYSGAVTIPDKVTYNDVEYSVTSIGESAFHSCSNLVKITIPEGVTSIERYAFQSCSSLAKITIPESVTSIGGYAFYGCGSLVKITISENSQLMSIGSNAFESCGSLTSIALPKSLTSIGDQAFNFSGLTSITIPEGVTSMGFGAFMYCKSLTSISFPENSQLTSIREGAFSTCEKLTSIILPESVTEIRNGAFSHCYNLITINVPEGVTSIEGETFKNCYNLTSINIPENSQLTSIGESAFSDCSSLTSITIPESVSEISNSAFYGCSNLTSINIPEGVTSIERYAFYGCSNLTSINIPESVMLIAYGAFSHCNNLKSIIIPENVEFIYERAFADCSALESVKVLATEPPLAYDNTFSDYGIKLCVPEEALEVYHTTAPWSSFGNIKTIGTAVEEISLSETSVTLTEGESIALSASVSPENVEDESVTWSSSDSNIANVDAEGKVSAVAPGTATITAMANDGSGVSASCEVIVVEEINYSLTFMVDGQVFQTETSNNPIEVVFPEAPEKEGHTFVEWFREESEMPQIVDFKNNADEMLYTNAPCTNTKWGDQFTSWDVLFDGDASTFFHSEYSEGVDSEDGLDHYLRVDMGEKIKKFSFTYTVRETIATLGNYSPSRIVVEGANTPDGSYTELAVLTNLPRTGGEVYNSAVISDGNAYRYIRFRVTETFQNVKVEGHPYFFMGEFGMKVNKDPQDVVYHALYSANYYKVYYYVGDELVNIFEIPYGGAMPRYVYEPTDDSETFVGWSGETYETMPAHDVTYVAIIDSDEAGGSDDSEGSDDSDAGYSLTFTVDGEVFQTETSETPIEVVFPEAPEKEGHSFVRWELSSSDATLTDIDIANNADAMLYSNAPCTNTKYGDQFTSWDVLFDDDYNTFFHSEYSEGVDSEDGLDHYLRVDMGEGNSVDQFAFSYAMRGDQYPNHTPTRIIVEGSNEANGKYDTIAVLTDLAEPPYDIDYTSEILGNGKEYRYIRYRVAQTLMNSLVCGHPYFYISEFGMKKAQDCYNAVYQGVYAPNKYKVYYYVGEELQGIVEVTYGDQMPNMLYSPTLDTEEFLGWISEDGETYETMPAHDVTYTANIKVYEKCATPTIGYANNRVVFSCETEGVEFRTQVRTTTERGYRTTDSEGFEFIPTYTFTTYAIKEGFVNSDDVSVTICWIDCTGEHEGGDDDTDIISVPSQPVIIQCINGVISLTGLTDGIAVAVYDTAGIGYGTAMAENGAATIATNLEAGSTAIVKIGERSVKVAVK